jgi:hypothetical protein
MNLDDQIESALRQRPSDERTYDEPLTALDDATGAVQPVRGRTRARFRLGGRPGLAGLAVVVALVAGMAAIWPRLQDTPTLVGAAPLQIQCRGEGAAGFSPDLLSGVGNAESGTSAAANVLRQFVASPDYGQGFPAKGWYAVEQTQDRVLFLAKGEGDDPSNYLEVEAKRSDAAQAGLFATDGWSVGANGGCALRSVPPLGFNSAGWDLDPAYPYAPGATELHVLVGEDACDGGTLISPDRIQVGVAYAGDRVVVTLVARTPQGPQTCPLRLGGSPYVVKLDQPIGNRELLDGGPWPAVSIASGGRAIIASTPTPYPSNWHMATDCTGDANFFKMASMSASYDVYCAVLPQAWTLESSSGPQNGNLKDKTPVDVSYRGPNGETFELREGPVCATASACTPRSSAGTAMFGDRQGQLGTGIELSADVAVVALSVGAGQDPAWVATGTGMSLETFKELAAALIVVAK